MTLKEFTIIIDRFGAESERWPKKIQDECKSFVATNAAAKNLLNPQRKVDALMKQLQVPDFPNLETRVLNQALPARSDSFIDRIIEWLIPQNSFGQQIWRPAIVACLPLVFGIVLGNFFSFGVAIEDDGFQYWDDELVMLSLTDYTEATF